MGGPHEDSPILGGLGPQEDAGQGKSLQSAPGEVPPAPRGMGFPSVAVPWPGLLQPQHCSSRSHSTAVSTLSSRPGLRSQVLWGPRRSPGPESRWTTAKPRLFSWPRLPAPQWGEGGSGKGRWQVGEKADCEFLEGRACHLYAWHLLSTLPGAQWTSVNANPRSSLCPTPACSSFPR